MRELSRQLLTPPFILGSPIRVVAVGGGGGGGGLPPFRTVGTILVDCRYIV